MHRARWLIERSIPDNGCFDTMVSAVVRASRAGRRGPRVTLDVNRLVNSGCKAITHPFK